MNKESLEKRLEEIRNEIIASGASGDCKKMISLIYEQTEITRQLQEIQLAEFSAARAKI